MRSSCRSCASPSGATFTGSSRASSPSSAWQWSPALPEAIDARRYQAIHEALLTGLLSNVGARDPEGEGYQGTRGLAFVLHPGSGLAKKSPRWVLAAELVETQRLYARVAARVEPEWIEAVAGERVTREHFEPHWDEGRGEVVASERVQLYGLTLVPRRRVSFGAIDGATAREVFIREALVPGALATRGAFLAHNRRLVAEVAELEHKARRQDVLVDDETIAAFYATRVPEGVCTLAGFERWREDAERQDPRVLCLTREALMRHAAAHVTEELFPESIAMAGTRLPVKYRFAPGHPLDGLTLTVPLALLNQLDDARLTWLVPGMVREKVTHYLKALPKAWRNRLVPLPDSVTAFLEAVPAVPSGRASLPEAIRGWLGERLRATPPPSVWDDSPLPPHLMVNLRVVDAAGRELGSDRDPAALRSKLGEAAQMTFAAAGPALEQKGMRAWECGDLPPTLTRVERGQRLTGYPALVDDTDSVSLALLDTPAAAERSTRAGVIRLIRFALKDAFARFEKGAPGFAQAALQLKPVIATDALLGDVLAAIADRAFIGDDALPRTATAFAEQVKRARTRLPAVGEGAFRLLATIAAAHYALSQRIAALPPSLSRLGAEVRLRRDALVHPGFFRATPWAQLNHLPRYLAAAERRLVKHAENPGRDARHAATLADWWRRLAERREADRVAGRIEPGFGGVPLAARGTDRLAVRAGAAHAAAGVLQAPGTCLDGARALTGVVFGALAGCFPTCYSELAAVRRAVSRCPGDRVAGARESGARRGGAKARTDSRSPANVRCPRERHDHSSGQPSAYAARHHEDPRRLSGSRRQAPARRVLGHPGQGRRGADGPRRSHRRPRRAAALPRRPRDAHVRAQAADGRVRAPAQEADRRQDIGQGGGQGGLFQGRHHQPDTRRHPGDGRVGDHREHHARCREPLLRRAADPQSRHRPPDGPARPRDRRQSAGARGHRDRVRRCAEVAEERRDESSSRS